MPLDLPRLHVSTESFDPVVSASCPEVPPDLARRLVELERGTVPVGAVDRCIALGDRSWAVGQRRGDDTLWRVVRPADAEWLSGNPAWLWTAEAWFDPGLGRDARARAPTATPLRQLVRLMAPLGGRNRRTVKTMGAVIAALRAGRSAGGPVAVVVERDLLSSASHPARWFVLGVLAILPPGRRDALRVSIGETNPSASEYDLVVCPNLPPGFVGIDAANPPDEGDDLVAYYVQNRLNEDDPEALEAASYLFDGEGDRWGDGIAALIRDGLPGVSEVTDALLDQDPDRAVAAIAARLRAGAPMDPTLLDQLVRVTLKTHDPRPWVALQRRPPLERADAVDALLKHASSLRPSGALVTALVDLYPRTAPLEPWVPSLLGWLRGGADPDAVSEALLTTLAEWPPTPQAPDLVTEVVRRLIALGRPDAAAAALASASGRRLIHQGHGAALVALWLQIPSPSPERVAAFCRAFVEADAPADAVDHLAELLRRLLDRETLAEAVLEAWLGRPAPPSADDPLFAVVRQTPLHRRWAELMVRHAAPGARAAALQPTDAGNGSAASADPVWLHVAEVLVEEDDDPRHTLLSLAQMPGAVGVDRAPAVARQAVEGSRFPDPVVANAAELLAAAPNAAPIWSLVAVAAADPDTWDDETIDATVVAFCEADADVDTMSLAAAALERLGRAARWEPLDHARWVVRLALAPAGVANVPLIVALLSGIRSRPDAVPFMAELLRPMLDLPPDHDASQLLIEELPDAGWQGEVLHQVIERVGPTNIPLSLRRTLVAMAEG